MEILHKYMKAIKKHQDHSHVGRARAYFLNTRKMKEQIKELRDEVNSVRIRFLVRHIMFFSGAALSLRRSDTILSKPSSLPTLSLLRSRRS